jgi:hypothetical protein
MGKDDAMDVAGVHKNLAAAVAQQVGSMVTLTLLAGTATGLPGAMLKDRLREYAQAEVTDTALLAEKLTALGGSLIEPEIPELGAEHFPEALAAFLEREEHVLAVLHGVIAYSGQEPQSEALEHLIEHVLLRKQQQVDFLRLSGV